MSNTELMLTAIVNASKATEVLTTIAQEGTVAPVPPGPFTTALDHLRRATAAAQELEQRARGVKPPRSGE